MGSCGCPPSLGKDTRPLLSPILLQACSAVVVTCTCIIWSSGLGRQQILACQPLCPPAHAAIMNMYTKFSVVTDIQVVPSYITLQ